MPGNGPRRPLPKDEELSTVDEEDLDIDALPPGELDEAGLVDSDALPVADEPEPEEEYQPGAVPEGDLDATRLYLSEIGFSPLLTAEEEVMYARRARRGDADARRRMIESNLRL